MSVVILTAMSLVMDYADFLDEHSENIVKLGINPQCNSARAICSASIMHKGNFQRISFSIKKSADNKKNLNMTSIVTGFDLEGIESMTVYLKSQDKEDDIPAVLLIPDKSGGQIVPEKWTAITRLPSTERKNTRETLISSNWHAIVRLKSSKKEYRAEFPFQF